LAPSLAKGKRMRPLLLFMLPGCRCTSPIILCLKKVGQRLLGCLGVWLTARGMELSADARERATVGVAVDHMGVLCFDGPCPGLPMSMGVTLPCRGASPGDGR
jgi:hypothetical protein